jgi:hypothetical protein
MDAKIFGRRWTHSFEEDTAGGQVYRPETWDFPLSRRPREAIVLNSDGSAEIFVSGAADRPQRQSASWTQDGDEIVIRARKKGSRAGATLRVIEHDPDRLLIRS